MDEELFENEETVMINVGLKLTGLDLVNLDVPEDSSVAVAIGEAGYGNDGFTITVNGEPASRGAAVYDGDIIVLSNRVKGARLIA